MCRSSLAGVLVLATATFSLPGRPGGLRNKAAFADPKLVSFVRPGLVVEITSATVSPDGTISVNFTATDPKNLPLDLQGVTTPGLISSSFVVSYVPKGGRDWVALTTRAQTSPITGNTANQPAAETGANFTSSGNAYTYHFTKKVPTGFRSLPDDANRDMGVAELVRVRTRHQLRQ